MLIDLAALRRQGGQQKYYWETEINPAQLLGEAEEAEAAEVVFLTPIRARVAAVMVEKLFTLDVEAEAEVEASCALCLRPVRRRLEVSFTVNYCYEGDVPYLGLADEEGELPEGYEVFGDRPVDLTGIIREHFYLALPMKVVCRDECKGLCPDCGCDLNEEECGCAGRRIDPRMEMLKKFWEPSD